MSGGSGYGVVWPSFWTGSTGRQLRGDATTQLVAVYLMTCSHKNSLGIYRCPPAYITTDTGIPLEGASKALRRLCEVGFCAIDETGETIWVFEMAFYQIGEELKAGDNRLKSVHRLFAEIENEQIQQAFFEKYGTAYQLPTPTARPKKPSPIVGAPKPLESPSEANNYNYSNNYNYNNHPSGGLDAPKKSGARKPKSSEKKSGVPTHLRLQGLRDVFLRQADQGGVPDGAAEFDRFLDHHRAKGSTFADWDAAGRTWLRNAVKFAAERKTIARGNQPPQFQERVTNGFATILAQSRRQEENHADSPIIDVTPNQPSGPREPDARAELDRRERSDEATGA